MTFIISYSLTFKNNKKTWDYSHLLKMQAPKYLGVKTDAEKAAEAAAEELRAEEAAAAKLEETIRDLQLEVTDLDIHIDDDAATVKGMAYDQATKEKVVLVIGNSEGIATVDDQMTVEHVEPEAQFHTVVSGGHTW